MRIFAALVLISENSKKQDKIHFSMSVDTVDDIETVLPEKAGNCEEGSMYYVWLRKNVIIDETWSIVGNASRFDSDWEVAAQYGVWACLYEIEPPPFKINPLSGNNETSSHKSKAVFDLSRYQETSSLTRFHNVLNKKYKSNKNLDKDFNILGNYCCSANDRKHKHQTIIEFPLLNKKEKKTRKCEVVLTPIYLSSFSVTKMGLFSGCPVVYLNAIDCAEKKDDNCGCL